MIQVILIVIAAIFKALVDTIAFHQGGIFHDQQFFDINRGGFEIPFTKYYIGGFHIFNSAMIISFIAACSFQPLIHLWWINIITLGIVFILVFNFFWNKIFN